MSTTDFGDPARIIHIPARDLTGTREAKLADLDTLLAQLQVVRLALCGQTVDIDGFTGGSHDGRSRWPLRSWPARDLHAFVDALTSRARRAKGDR